MQTWSQSCPSLKVFHGFPLPFHASLQPDLWPLTHVLPFSPPTFLTTSISVFQPKVCIGSGGVERVWLVSAGRGQGATGNRAREFINETREIQPLWQVPWCSCPSRYLGVACRILGAKRNSREIWGQYPDLLFVCLFLPIFNGASNMCQALGILHILSDLILQ